MGEEVPNILLEIKAEKEKEIAHLKRCGALEDYREKAKDTPRGPSFYHAITAPGFHLIAEFKKASPSAGEIRPGAIPEEIARLYEECGASAISVLTDYPFFKGNIGYLGRIRGVVNIPCLRKDFMLDPVQFHRAKVYGADAVLLIAALLETSQIRDFVGLSKELGMDALVESHNLGELEKAIEGGAEIFGINNRDLHTFDVDIGTTRKLIKYVPEGMPVISESGIKTAADAAEVRAAGAKGILVGGSLMDAKANPTLDDMRNKIYELVGRRIGG